MVLFVMASDETTNVEAMGPLLKEDASTESTLAPYNQGKSTALTDPVSEVLGKAMGTSVRQFHVPRVHGTLRFGLRRLQEAIVPFIFYIIPGVAIQLWVVHSVIIVTVDHCAPLTRLQLLFAASRNLDE